MTGSDGGDRDTASPVDGLTLLVAGDAPSSVRARKRLQAVLQAMGMGQVIVEEVDVLLAPTVALEYRVFATPALVCVRRGVVGEVLYGDLSDPEPLRHFLEQHG